MEIPACLITFADAMTSRTIIDRDHIISLAKQHRAIRTRAPRWYRSCVDRGSWEPCDGSRHERAYHMPIRDREPIKDPDHHSIKYRGCAHPTAAISEKG
jgi:hypothetical protein